MGERGGGRRLRGTWDLGTSFDENPLFLSAMRSLRPFLGFNTIPSPSSEVVSTRAITSSGEWVAEDLSSSPSESKTSTSLPGASSSSLKQNWSISALREKREEAVSSLGATTFKGERWRGSSIGGKSLWAKKPGTETSMPANLGSLTLIAWPVS